MYKQIIKVIIFSLITMQSTIAKGEDLFIGDSLTYQLALSYQAQRPAEARYLEGTGLKSVKLLDWQKYIQQIRFKQYDTVYIVLGTNDLIESSEIQLYLQKARGFIHTIKQQNNNVIWILPPALQNSKKNKLLNNTRLAIVSAVYYENIKLIDMQKILGEQYTASINGVKVRTSDGIHITGKGAEYIIRKLLASDQY